VPIRGHLKIKYWAGACYRSIAWNSRDEALVTNARLFSIANSELLVHKNAIATGRGAAARFCIAYFRIKPLILDHRACTDGSRSNRAALLPFQRGRGAGGRNLSLALWVDGDVLQKQMVLLMHQDGDATDCGAFLDDPGGNLPRSTPRSCRASVLHPQLELDVMVADGAAMREAFGAGKLDLALADTVSLRPAPRRQRECPLAWVAAPAFDRREAKSCRWFSPVTRASGACGWYRRSIGVGRPWRTAFESGSLTAIQAAVRAGMGVATLLPWNVENGMAHRDAEANRLPPAPSVKLALYRRPGLRNDPVTDMLEKLLWNAVL
jgi:hypothetical protein